MVNLSLFIFILQFGISVSANSTNNTINLDRYIALQTQATNAQHDELKTIISISFPKGVNSVIEAIEHLLLRSSYKLSLNYQAEILKDINLPIVHRKLGPLTLKQTIQVLIGQSWKLEIDDVYRHITINLKSSNNHRINSKFKPTPKIKPSLKDIVKVNIQKERFDLAIKKILPKGWRMPDIENGLANISVSIVAEDVPRIEVIGALIKQVGADFKVFKKMKYLVIRKNKTLKLQQAQSIIQ